MAAQTEIEGTRLKAIALLAGGMNQTDTASNIGVSRVTVCRWMKDEAFATELQAEIDRRQQRLQQGLEKATNEIIDADVSAFKKELQEYHDMLRKVQLSRMAWGKSLAEKAMKRFRDLPEEAIAIKDIPALIRAGDDLIRGGLDNWGDALALQDVLDKFDAQQD